MGNSFKFYFINQEAWVDLIFVVINRLVGIEIFVSLIKDFLTFTRPKLLERIRLG